MSLAERIKILECFLQETAESQRKLILQPHVGSHLLAPLSVAVSRPNNVFLLDENTILTCIGNLVLFIDAHSGAMSWMTGPDGDGVGCVAVHPREPYFVVAGSGSNPSVTVYEWPSKEVFTTLQCGPTTSYVCAAFNPAGDRLAICGGAPDFTLSLCNWRLGSVTLRAKTFSALTYKIAFSPYESGRLVSAGSAHIKAWTVANTFTGLKLQGATGRFGRTDISDIAGVGFLPNGSIISGSESGYLLVWVNDLVVCRIGTAEARTVSLTRQESASSGGMSGSNGSDGDFNNNTLHVPDFDANGLDADADKAASAVEYGVVPAHGGAVTCLMMLTKEGHIPTALSLVDEQADDDGERPPVVNGGDALEFVVTAGVDGVLRWWRISDLLAYDAHTSASLMSRTADTAEMTSGSLCGVVAEDGGGTGAASGRLVTWGVRPVAVLPLFDGCAINAMHVHGASQRVVLSDSMGHVITLPSLNPFTVVDELPDASLSLAEAGPVPAPAASAPAAHVVRATHAGPVNCIATSPCDHAVATGGADGSVRLYNLLTGEVMLSRRFGPSSTSASIVAGVSHLSFLPLLGAEGLFLLAVFEDGIVRVLRRTASRWRLEACARPFASKIAAVSVMADVKQRVLIAAAGTRDEPPSSPTTSSSAPVPAPRSARADSLSVLALQGNASQTSFTLEIVSWTTLPVPGSTAAPPIDPTSPLSPSSPKEAAPAPAVIDTSAASAASISAIEWDRHGNAALTPYRPALLQVVKAGNDAVAPAGAAVADSCKFVYVGYSTGAVCAVCIPVLKASAHTVSTSLEVAPAVLSLLHRTGPPITQAMIEAAELADKSASSKGGRGAAANEGQSFMLEDDEGSSSDALHAQALEASATEFAAGMQVYRRISYLVSCASSSGDGSFSFLMMGLDGANTVLLPAEAWVPTSAPTPAPINPVNLASRRALARLSSTRVPVNVPAVCAAVLAAAGVARTADSADAKEPLTFPEASVEHPADILPCPVNASPCSTTVSTSGAFLVHGMSNARIHVRPSTTVPGLGGKTPSAYPPAGFVVGSAHDGSKPTPSAALSFDDTLAVSAGSDGALLIHMLPSPNPDSPPVSLPRCVLLSPAPSPLGKDDDVVDDLTAATLPHETARLVSIITASSAATMSTRDALLQRAQEIIDAFETLERDAVDCGLTEMPVDLPTDLPAIAEKSAGILASPAGITLSAVLQQRLIAAAVGRVKDLRTQLEADNAPAALRLHKLCNMYDLRLPDRLDESPDEPDRPIGDALLEELLNADPPASDAPVDNPSGTPLSVDLLREVMRSGSSGVGPLTVHPLMSGMSVTTLPTSRLSDRQLAVYQAVLSLGATSAGAGDGGGDGDDSGDAPVRDPSMQGGDLSPNGAGPSDSAASAGALVAQDTGMETSASMRSEAGKGVVRTSVEKVEERLEMRRLRREALARMEAQRHTATAADPADEEAIARASATVGTYQLRCEGPLDVDESEEGVVRFGGSERLTAADTVCAMALLDAAACALSGLFNRRVLALRQQKASTLRRLQLLSVRMHQLTGQLSTLGGTPEGVATALSVAGLPAAVADYDMPGVMEMQPEEYPERSFTATDSDLAHHSRQIRKEARDKRRAEQLSQLVGDAEDAPARRDDSDSEDSGSGLREGSDARSHISRGQRDIADARSVNTRDHAAGLTVQPSMMQRRGSIMGGKRGGGGPNAAPTGGAARIKYDSLIRERMGAVTVSDLQSEENNLRVQVISAQLARLKMRARRMTTQFDDSVAALFAERAQLAHDVTRANLSRLLLIQELALLRVHAVKEEGLHATVQAKRADVASVAERVNACQQALRSCKEEIDGLLENETTIVSDFRALMTSVPQQHASYLTRVFRRKAAFSSGDGEEEEEEEEEDSMDDMSRDSADDEAGPTTRPEDLGHDLLRTVVALRSRRVQQEAKMDAFQKKVDAHRLTNAQLLRLEATANAELATAESAVADLQGKLRHSLHGLETVVVLSLRQFRCATAPVSASAAAAGQTDVVKLPAVSSGRRAVTERTVDGGASEREMTTSDQPSIPPSLESTVVFPVKGLEALEERIHVLRAEAAAVAQSCEEGRRTLTTLQRQEKAKLAERRQWEAKTLDVSLLKFGQRVDLDVLESISVDRETEDLRALLRKTEATWDVERCRQADQLDVQKEALAAATAANSALLRDVAALQAQKQSLEVELASAHNKVRGGGGGSAPVLPSVWGAGTATPEEAAAVKDLIVVQQQEVDSLRAERAILKRKGGHVYALPSAT